MKLLSNGFARQFVSLSRMKESVSSCSFIVPPEVETGYCGTITMRELIFDFDNCYHKALHA